VVQVVVANESTRIGGQVRTRHASSRQERTLDAAQVFKVSIPALSTNGYGYGIDLETGGNVCFCSDHRPLRNFGEALRLASEPPEIEIEPWQIL
jgi:hypothetical protein